MRRATHPSDTRPEETQHGFHGAHPALARLNGSALLTLVATLLIATWPFFGAFTTAAIAAGLVMSVVMDSWNKRHPSTHPAPQAPNRLRAEINLSSIPVGGDVGGLIFAAGSVVILLGLPALRWFLVGSIACAVAVAVALIVWRHLHNEPARCELSIASASH